MLSTLTDLQVRKYTRRFYTLDANGSGYLELVDYLSVATRMCAACHVSITEPPGLFLVEAYMGAFARLWRQTGWIMQAQISPEEFITAMGTALAGRPEVFDRGLLPVAEQILDVCDRDQDGSLNQDEFACFLAGYAVPPAEATLVMQRLDHDGNGLLTRKQFIDHSREFYCGNDPDAPGNWLFGPL